MNTDVTPENQVNSSSTDTSTTPADTSDSLGQFKEIAAQVWDRLGDAPDYVSGFVSEYKRPITVITLFLGALISIKLTLAVLGAINDIPVLAPLFELIGLLYSGWFIYRFLWKAANRQELLDSLNDLKNQVLGQKS